MSKGQEDMVRRYYTQMWNQWNFDLCEELLSSAIRFRGSLGPEIRGIEGFKGYMRQVHEAFPDFVNIIEEMISADQKVVARLRYEGTHQGKLLGIPPTGKRVAYAGVAIFTLDGSRIAQGWVMGERLGLLEQVLRPNFWMDCLS